MKSVFKKFVSVFQKAFTKALSVIRPLCSSVTGLFFKTSRVFAAIAAAVVLALGSATVALAGAVVAYDVIYNGDIICTVKQVSDLQNAKNMAVEKINNPECNSEIINVKLNQTIVSSKNLVTAEDLSDIIIKKSENIIKIAVLNINNKSVAMADAESTITTALNEYIDKHKAITGSENLELTNDVSVESIYTTKQAAEALPLASTSVIEDNNVPFTATQTVTETREIPYSTKKNNSNKFYAGTEKVETEGKAGMEELTYKIVSENGSQTEKQLVSSRVVVSPVDKVVTVGTKKISNKNKSTSTIMCWPVQRVAGSYVSSYVGDGRGHKGMDIVAKAGTPIFAGASGTVVSASYDRSGYGNCIIIDHHNGYRSLYAHCSTMLVKVGDTVSKGENIATVGRTGRATGNHLHFEVRKGSEILNPAKFIGTN